MPNRELDTAYYALSRRMARVERQATRMATHQTWTGRTASEIQGTWGVAPIPVADPLNSWANAIAAPDRLLAQPIVLAPGKWFVELSSTVQTFSSSPNVTYWANFGLYSPTLVSVINMGTLITRRINASGVVTFEDTNVRLSRLIDLSSTHSIEVIAEGFNNTWSGVFTSVFVNQSQNHRIIAIPV